MATPPYIVQTDLENALSAPTILSIFDDENTGSVNAAAITDVCLRASYFADSWLASVYTGPFPITAGPIPALMKQLALEYAIAFSFERRPEFARAFGDQPRADRFKRADELGKRLKEAVLRMPDLSDAPANVGGLVVAGVVDEEDEDAAPRLFDFGNTGDF